MQEAELKQIIAQNIAAYRRTENITQSELAGMLNYSDKAVSKWERAESMPDIYILYRIAEIFHTTVNDLMTPHAADDFKPVTAMLKRRLIIPLLAISIVWVIATVTFVFLNMFQVPWDNWMCFLYAFPVSFIVGIVFSAKWWRPLTTGLFISGLMWSIAMILHLSIPIDNGFFLYFIPIPMQIIVILWYVMLSRPRFRKAIERIYSRFHLSGYRQGKRTPKKSESIKDKEERANHENKNRENNDKHFR